MRIVNLLLLALIAVGVAMFVRQTRINGGLRPKLERLTNRYGRMDVGDGTKFQIIKLETDSKQVFRWRVYQPANIKTGFGLYAPGKHFSQASFFQAGDSHLLTLGFRFEGDRISVSKIVDSSGTSGSLMAGNIEGHKWLQQHWGELQFESVQSGAIEVSRPIPFLKVTLPANLSKEQRNELGFKHDEVTTFLYGVDSVVEKYAAELEAQEDVQ